MIVAESRLSTWLIGDGIASRRPNLDDIWVMRCRIGPDAAKFRCWNTAQRVLGNDREFWGKPVQGQTDRA